MEISYCNYAGYTCLNIVMGIGTVGTMQVWPRSNGELEWYALWDLV